MAALRHSGSPNIDPYHSEGEQRVQLGEVGRLSCKIYNVANRWEWGAEEIEARYK